MKKILCILLAVILFIIVACGIYLKVMKYPQNVDNQLKENEMQKENEETPQKEEYGKFQLPRMEMYCNVPMKSGASTNKRVGVVTGYDEYIGTVFCGGTGEYIGELEGILASVADDYARDTAMFLFADLDAEALKQVSSEKTTISGYDAVKFSTSVKTESNKTNEIYGYAMIIEDRPVVFMGVLCSEEQAKEDLKEMQDLVDLMAGSIYK